MELCQGRFRLDIWKSFFTKRIIGHCNRLPRAVVTATCLTNFMEGFDNTLKSTVEFLGLSYAEPTLGLHDPCGSLPVKIL